MHTTTKISADLHRVIMLRSTHNRFKTRSKALHHVVRHESEFGTKSYRDALQRAFNKAKEQIYFNPDMTNFVTLTYRRANQDVEDVLRDVKNMFRIERRSCPAGSGRKTPKYLFIMEYQKRGSIHVHMIANDCFTLEVNKNGYNSLTHWSHGYSSILSIKDFDSNFRPYLYLFKYMKKSQRIGKSFVHTSRNLNNYTTLTDSSLVLTDWKIITTEVTKTDIQNMKFTYFRDYLQFNGKMQISNDNQEEITCHEQVKLHSTKELEKLLKNHLKR